MSPEKRLKYIQCLSEATGIAVGLIVDDLTKEIEAERDAEIVEMIIQETAGLLNRADEYEKSGREVTANLLRGKAITSNELARKIKELP